MKWFLCVMIWVIIIGFAGFLKVLQETKNTFKLLFPTLIQLFIVFLIDRYILFPREFAVYVFFIMILPYHFLFLGYRALVLDLIKFYNLFKK